MSIDQTMSDFDQTPYQTKIFPELAHIIQAGKIPNAFLFLGNNNTGRKEAALSFAKGCNCLNGMEGLACNDCKSCRKIDADSHPDILYVDLLKGKKIISIAQVRKLGLTLSSKPNEARYRMVLISDADRMNTQAQNALLKLLEEPPEKTFFILIADRASLLIPTILSRCRKLRFKPLTDKSIAHCLVTDYNVDTRSAHIASQTADSDIKKALMYLNIGKTAKDMDWVKKRRWLIKTLGVLAGTDITNGITTGLRMSQKLTLEPEIIDDAMAVIKTFFRDLLIFRFHPEKIVNLDFFDIFEDISQRVETKILYVWIENFYKTEKKLMANCSLRLTLDYFFLKIAMGKGRVIYD